MEAQKMPINLGVPILEEHLCTKIKIEPELKQRHKLVEDKQCYSAEFGSTRPSFQSHWRYLGEYRLHQGSMLPAFKAWVSACGSGPRLSTIAVGPATYRAERRQLT